MKKFLVFGAVLAVAVLAYYDFREQAAPRSNERLRPRGLEVRRHAAVGGWEVPGRPAPAVESPLEIAEKYLKDHAEEMGLKDYHEMRASVFQTPLGAKVSYQVFQDGIPVVGSEIRLQIGRDQTVMDVDNRYLPVERVEISGVSALSSAQVQDLMQVSNYLPDPSVGGDPAQVIFPVPGPHRAELAYVVAAREPSGLRRPVQVVLRAADGQVLGKNVSRMEFQ
jgi:hypothetical protein